MNSADFCFHFALFSKWWRHVLARAAGRIGKFDGKPVTACWALRFWGNIFNRKPWKLGVSLKTIDGSSSCRSRRRRFGTRWQIAPALIGQLEALMVRADFAKKKKRNLVVEFITKTLTKRKNVVCVFFSCETSVQSLTFFSQLDQPLWWYIFCCCCAWWWPSWAYTGVGSCKRWRSA